jgi:hypothetical protein
MFKRVVVAVGLAALVAACGAKETRAQDKQTEYTIRGEEAEACECDSVCPCIWTKDVSFSDCRSILVWTIERGSYGTLDLSGTSFGLALTHSGKNIVGTMGKWEGTIYTDERATEAQKKAIVAICSTKWGKAFAKVDVKSAPIEFHKDGDKRSVTIGKVAVVKMTGLQGSDGKVPAIENPPFAIIPKLYCAKADVHTFDDGTTKWDFSGRNAFYGPYEYQGR